MNSHLLRIIGERGEQYATGNGRNLLLNNNGRTRSQHQSFQFPVSQCPLRISTGSAPGNGPAHVSEGSQVQKRVHQAGKRIGIPVLVGNGRAHHHRLTGKLPVR